MSRLIRILSIDGGGVRGIIPAQILLALERKLIEKSGDPNAQISDYFDLIAGTSTGGILACLLLCPDGETNRPRYTAGETLEVYLKYGGKIFSQSFFQQLRTVGGLTDEKYSSEGIEGVLDHYFGEVRMSELIKPCMVTAYDIRRRKTVFFTQHDAKESDTRDFLVKDAARATSAAPTYFEVANIESMSGVHYPCIDGGVFANNPALCAYAEARTHFGAKAADMMLLSLGTGNLGQPYHFEDAKDWGSVSWIKPLINIMMTGVSETVDYECRLAFDAIGVPTQYRRINTDIQTLDPEMSTDLDDASPENLQGLSELGIELAETYDEYLDECVEMLIPSD